MYTEYVENNGVKSFGLWMDLEHDCYKSSLASKKFDGNGWHKLQTHSGTETAEGRTA